MVAGTHVRQEPRRCELASSLGLIAGSCSNDVEAGAGDLAGLDQTGQLVFVDHLAAGGVDDDRRSASEA